jgi:hypothetical protein
MDKVICEKRGAEQPIRKVWAKKSGKPTSRRFNHLPLLPSGPGGVRRELAVPICHCKGTKIIMQRKFNLQNNVG